MCRYLFLFKQKMESQVLPYIGRAAFYLPRAEVIAIHIPGHRK